MTIGSFTQYQKEYYIKHWRKIATEWIELVTTMEKSVLIRMEEIRILKGTDGQHKENKHLTEKE